MIQQSFPRYLPRGKWKQHPQPFSWEPNTGINVNTHQQINRQIIVCLCSGIPLIKQKEQTAYAHKIDKSQKALNSHLLNKDGNLKKPNTKDYTLSFHFYDTLEKT